MGGHLIRKPQGHQAGSLGDGVQVVGQTNLEQVVHHPGGTKQVPQSQACQSPCLAECAHHHQAVQFVKQCPSLTGIRRQFDVRLVKHHQPIETVVDRPHRVGCDRNSCGVVG